MDNFHIPKKVNRHVLKAVNMLSSFGCYVAPTECIIQEVKHQMRNLIPVPDVDNCIRRALQNFVDFGVIEKSGNYGYKMSDTNRNVALGVGNANKHAEQVPIAKKRKFYFQNLDIVEYEHPEETDDEQQGNIFHTPLKRCTSSISKFDTKRKRCTGKLSDDSLSGDEFERTRKRLRTSKKIKHEGNSTLLPNAVQVPSNSTGSSSAQAPSNSSDNPAAQMPTNNSADSASSINMSFPFSYPIFNHYLSPSYFDCIDGNRENLSNSDFNFVFSKPALGHSQLSIGERMQSQINEQISMSRLNQIQRQPKNETLQLTCNGEKSDLSKLNCNGWISSKSTFLSNETATSQVSINDFKESEENIENAVVKKEDQEDNISAAQPKSDDTKN